MIDRSKLIPWLKRQLYVTRKESPCTMLVLRHVIAGKEGGEVDTITVPEKPTADFVEGAATQFEAAACADAVGLGPGTVQGYQIQAVFEGSKGLPLSRYSFREEAPTDIEEGNPSAASEPATKTGIIAQTMRHQEATMRLSLVQGQQVGQVISSLQRTIEAQQAQLDKMTEERWRSVNLAEELLSRKHERELATRAAERSDKMKTEAFEKVSLLMPVLVNKIAGVKLLPEKAGGIMATVKELGKSIRPEQMEGFMRILDPDQAIAFNSVLEAVAEAEAREKKNGAAAPEAH